MNDRAQAAITPIPLVAAMILVLFVLVAGQFASVAPAGSEIEVVCNGVCGCGPCPGWYYAVGGAAVLFAVLAVVKIAVANPLLGGRSP